MALVDRLSVVEDKVKRRLGRTIPLENTTRRMLPDSAVSDLVAGAGSELGRLTFGHDGRVVHKWTHYPDIYERHFAPYRKPGVRMLEIGVNRGGSLEVWRDYFGPDAVIFGIDIDPECATLVDAPNQVRIGSQDDPAFLADVVKEMGGVDIILDDGSHISEHQSASFRALFPLLDENGIYAIEDLHTAYWPGDYHGGYRRAGTGIEIVKDMIDDLHAWYHDKPEKIVDKESIVGIHLYDSIAFIDKGRKAEPKNIKIGKRPA